MLRVYRMGGHAKFRMFHPCAETFAYFSQGENSADETVALFPFAIPIEYLLPTTLPPPPTLVHRRVLVSLENFVPRICCFNATAQNSSSRSSTSSWMLTESISVSFQAFKSKGSCSHHLLSICQVLPGFRMASPADISLDVVERILFISVLSYFLSNILWLIGLGFYTWFFTFVVIGAATVVILDKMRVNPAGKAVLITGCDTGFGNATAKKLNAMGYQVFAGCLFDDKGGALELKSEGVEVFKMDVSKDVDLGFLEAKLNAKGTKLWAVITNAGLSTFGEVEWVPMDVYEKILNVNLLGTIRTAKACLPYLRKGNGRVITVASMMGRFGAPSRSPYTVSKWAVEGFSEVLRLEMRRWNVPVCIVEPGNFVAATALYEGDAIKRQSDYMWNNMTEETRNAYTREYFDNQIATMTYYSKNGNTDTSPVIQSYVDAVTHTYPQTRYQIMSPQEKIKCFVATHLPSIIYDNIYY